MKIGLLLLLLCATCEAGQLEAPLRAVEQASPDRRNSVLWESLDHLDFRNIRPAEEVGILRDYLHSGDVFMEITAARLVGMLLLYHRDEETLRAFRLLAPEMQARFDDPDPDPNIVQVKASFWKESVMLYIEAVGITPERKVLLGMEAALQDDNNAKILGRAAEALASLKPLPKEVLDALLAKAHDSSAQGARSAVLCAFAFWRVAEPAVIQEMTTALESEVPYERYAGARGLARLEGLQIRGAESALEKVIGLRPLDELDREASEEAKQALAKIDAIK